MTSGTFDIHPHVIANDQSRYPPDPIGGTRSGWSQERPVTTEQLLAAMDRAGVEKAAVVQSSTVYGHDNSYLADTVAAHPDKFTGVFSVDVLAEDAVDRIRHWQGLGLTGLRLFTAGSTMPGQSTWFDDPRTEPVWEYAGETGLPVCMQMRAAGLPRLQGLLTKYPRVRIVLDHLARPELADGPPYAAAKSLFDLGEHPNVYLKVTIRNVVESGVGAATPETFFGKLVETFGADRIAWGSNYPAAEGTLTELHERGRAALSFLPDQAQGRVFCGTAAEIYPALAAAPADKGSR